MMASNGSPANDDFHKLFLVVKDLAQQLDENRQATAKLKLHADLLKEQLRVYKFGESTQNGQYESSVQGNAIDDLLNERDELARENQFLRRELQDMGDLVRDYEKGMQAITASIRDHAFQESKDTIKIHQAYEQKLNVERLEKEQLQNAVIESDARLLKVSELLRKAHFEDHESDRTIEEALHALQTQNKGLRMALGLPVESNDTDKDILFTTEEQVIEKAP